MKTITKPVCRRELQDREVRTYVNFSRMPDACAFLQIADFSKTAFSKRPGKSGQIRANPGKSGQIRANPGKSGQIFTTLHVAGESR